MWTAGRAKDKVVLINKLFEMREKVCVGIVCMCYPNVPIQHVAARLFVSTCLSDVHAHLYVLYYCTRHLFHVRVCVCSFVVWMFLRQPISPSVVPWRYARVIPLPQSRDGRLWAPAKASAASTKLRSVFRSQGPSQLQPGLSAPCLCPV